MKGHVNTKNGEISIENQVIAKYAGICALGCFGIVGMAMVNMKDGIAKLLTRDNIRKGVFVSVNNNKITIDFHIIVSYGVFYFYSGKQSYGICKVSCGRIYKP